MYNIIILCWLLVAGRRKSGETFKQTACEWFISNSSPLALAKIGHELQKKLSSLAAKSIELVWLIFSLFLLGCRAHQVELNVSVTEKGQVRTLGGEVCWIFTLNSLGDAALTRKKKFMQEKP